MLPETLTARAVLYDNGSREMGRAEITTRLREVGFDQTLHTVAPAPDRPMHRLLWVPTLGSRSVAVPAFTPIPRWFR
ncbi:hypothetical protein GCM10027089_15650 [Nocardia thraciensis]